MTGLFQRILDAVMGIVMSLIRGIIGAPFAALKAEIEVRRARSDELLNVRHTVLRHGQPRETANFEGDTDPESRHWVADRNGVTVGVVTVIRKDEPDGRGEKWQLRGMAVLPDVQGKGVGAAMLTSVHTEVDEPMWCNARKTAVAFYAKHGWTPHGDLFDIDPIGPHQRMTWQP